MAKGQATDIVSSEPRLFAFLNDLAIPPAVIRISLQKTPDSVEKVGFGSKFICGDYALLC
jgi:hypothetical protein